MEKYKVIIQMNGMKMTLEKTQTELAKILLEEGVKLISVNDSSTIYCRSKKKKK